MSKNDFLLKITTNLKIAVKKKPNIQKKYYVHFLTRLIAEYKIGSKKIEKKEVQPILRCAHLRYNLFPISQVKSSKTSNLLFKNQLIWTKKRTIWKLCFFVQISSVHITRFVYIFHIRNIKVLKCLNSCVYAVYLVKIEKNRKKSVHIWRTRFT